MMQDIVAATEKTVRDIIGEIHTAIPGKIQSYDLNTGLVSVLPYGTYHCHDGRSFPYPVISGVPIVSMGYGETVVAVPIKPDMDCLLIIAEQSLDQWLYDTQTHSELSYDLTNAVAIPGLSKTPLACQIEANQSGSVLITNGAVKIEVASSGVNVTGAITILGNLNIQGNVTCAGSAPWKEE